MARAVVSPCDRVASNVTLLLPGMRPLMMMVAWLSSSSARSEDMAVATRTDVSIWILRLMAHGADRSACLHQGAYALHERRRLGGGDVKSGHGRLLVRLFLD